MADYKSYISSLSAIFFTWNKLEFYKNKIQPVNPNKESNFLQLTIWKSYFDLSWLTTIKSLLLL